MADNPLQVGHYRLLKTLGIGAFGKVKLGKHVVTGHLVAIKILNRNRIKQLDMGEKVRREINILKMCTHPHIIRLYEVIDTPSDIFVVMEYVPNGELFDYIVSKGRLNADEARRFFHQIISGVEYCHFHHIVHRDLKPENLLLDADNNIKLADFGLSNIMKDGDFLRTSCGSPNYAAPEVISGNLYAGPEVDVWSCGVILYALLCGSLPFDDESIPNLFKKIKSGMYTLPSHLSQLARDLIPRMLVVDPMKRITIPEIRQHPWFQHKLPAYLRLPPELIEKQERVIDDECIREVCAAPFRGANCERVVQAVRRQNGRHDLRVAYEIILDHKQAKQRTAEVMMLMQQTHHESTPPAFSPHQARTPGSGAQTPTGQQSQHMAQRLAEEASRALARHNPGMAGNPGSGGSGGVTPQPQGIGGSGGAGGSGGLGGSMGGPPGASQANPASKKRRWYLGIQSKKDPAHVITEVYKALLQLRCEWTAVSSYRLKVRWRPNAVLYHSHTHAHQPELMLQLSRQASSSRGSGKWGSGGTGHGGTPAGLARRSSSGAGSTDASASGSASGAGGGGGGAGAAMEVVAADPSPDFWPVDPSTLEDDNPLLRHDYTVIIGLNLYKVQQNIYLLDFQRVEGDGFSFMNLSAKIITELKTLSAASRQAQAAQAAMMMQQQQQQQQQMAAQQQGQAAAGGGGGGGASSSLPPRPAPLEGVLPQSTAAGGGGGGNGGGGVL